MRSTRWAARTGRRSRSFRPTRPPSTPAGDMGEALRQRQDLQGLLPGRAGHLGQIPLLGQGRGGWSSPCHLALNECRLANGEAPREYQEGTHRRPARLYRHGVPGPDHPGRVVPATTRAPSRPTKRASTFYFARRRPVQFLLRPLPHGQFRHHPAHGNPQRARPRPHHPLARSTAPSGARSPPYTGVTPAATSRYGPTPSRRRATSTATWSTS